MPKLSWQFTANRILMMAKKTLNYNHKPQYIAIKTYQIMPCALPVPAFLPLSYRFAKFFIFMYLIQHLIQYFSQCKHSSVFMLTKVNKSYQHLEQQLCYSSKGSHTIMLNHKLSQHAIFKWVNKQLNWIKICLTKTVYSFKSEQFIV